MTDLDVLKDRRYFYLATVISVYDGDTITVNVDLGFSIQLAGVKVRLDGIDTAEIRSKNKELKEKAIIARDWLREVCLGQKVFLKSSGQDKYGRWLGTIYTQEGLCCNEELVRLGHAVPYDGGKKQQILTD